MLTAKSRPGGSRPGEAAAACHAYRERPAGSRGRRADQADSTPASLSLQLTWCVVDILERM